MASSGTYPRRRRKLHRVLPNVPAVQEHSSPGSAPSRPGDHLHRGGLPRPVGPQVSGGLSRPHRETHAVHNRRVAVVLGQPYDLEHLSGPLTPVFESAVRHRRTRAWTPHPTAAAATAPAFPTRIPPLMKNATAAAGHPISHASNSGHGAAIHREPKDVQSAQPDQVDLAGGRRRTSMRTFPEDQKTSKEATASSAWSRRRSETQTHPGQKTT